MKVLIQQKETGLYFKDINGWIHDSADAMNFLSSTSAIDICRMNKISGVQIVLKFEEERYDIVLPAPANRVHRGEEIAG